MGRKGGERVRKLLEKQKHLAQKRRGAEAEKKIRNLSIVNLCVSASLREFAHFFKPSEPFCRARAEVPN